MHTFGDLVVCVPLESGVPLTLFFMNDSKFHLVGEFCKEIRYELARLRQHMILIIRHQITVVGAGFETVGSWASTPPWLPLLDSSESDPLVSVSVELLSLVSMLCSGEGIFVIPSRIVLQKIRIT